MELIETQHCYLVKGVFPEHIICGFTKRCIDGFNPEENFTTLQTCLSDACGLAYLKQIHSSNICMVERPGLYTGDGLFSCGKELALMVKSADCLPLFFYEPARDIIGMVHLGWRPASQGILDNISLNIKKTVILAGVGMRECCYEVGEEFLGDIRLCPCIENRERSLYFNPIQFVKSQLIPRGFRENAMYDIDICNFCDDRFHSFRREHTKKRTLSFIVRL